MSYQFKIYTLIINKPFKITFMQNIPTEGVPGFDWDAYEASCPSKGRNYNKKVTDKYPDAKVRCHEDYALELYEMMMEYPVVPKDFNDGDVIPITSLSPVSNDSMKVELSNGLQFDMEMSREKKFSEIHGIDSEHCD